MGALLPNGNDIDVINKLTDRFTGARLTRIRNYIRSSGDDFIGGRDRTLARAAFRLKVWPGSGRPARRRWFAFVGRILSRQNRIDIQQALKAAIDNAAGNIVGVQFWAQFDQSVPLNTYVVKVTSEPADASGNVFTKITLLCDHEIPPNETGDGDPGRDPGETGPVNPLHRRRKRKPTRKAKTVKKTKPAKKAKKVKKAKKKAGKK